MVYVVLRKNAETRTALVYKRLVFLRNISWEVAEVAYITGGDRNDMLDIDFPNHERLQ